MMGKNSDEVAGLIQRWLVGKGLGLSAVILLRRSKRTREGTSALHLCDAKMGVSVLTGNQKRHAVRTLKLNKACAPWQAARSPL
jgi:hypothetical protein